MIEAMIRVAREAADVLRERSKRDFVVDWKGKDDPVTELDRDLNALVCSELARAYPSVPIVAEEGDPASWEARKTAREVFFVDPVDGTRELIDRTGHFCVMIGFAREGRALGGVVAWPGPNRVFAAWDGEGFELANDVKKPLCARDVGAPAEARALVSRSHPDPRTHALLDRAGITHKTPFGSTGLKVVLVASGEAQAYVHVPSRGGGKLWDACGPEAIAIAAGATFTDSLGDTLDYRGELSLEKGLLVGTPNVHAWILAASRS